MNKFQAAHYCISNTYTQITKLIGFSFIFRLIWEQSVLSVPEQLKYFKHYKIRLRELVGEGRAEHIIRNAVMVMSMGTNDFLQNYYLEPIRSKEYTVEEYENFLVSRMADYVKVLPTDLLKSLHASLSSWSTNTSRFVSFSFSFF